MLDRFVRIVLRMIQERRGAINHHQRCDVSSSSGLHSLLCHEKQSMKLKEEGAVEVRSTSSSILLMQIC